MPRQRAIARGASSRTSVAPRRRDAVATSDGGTPSLHPPRATPDGGTPSLHLTPRATPLGDGDDMNHVHPCLHGHMMMLFYEQHPQGTAARSSRNRKHAASTEQANAFKGNDIMPELPEVETVRTIIAPQVTNRRIISVNLLNGKVVAHPMIDEFCKRLCGNTICSMDRRGKFLSFILENGDRLSTAIRSATSIFAVSVVSGTSATANRRR